jgi:hypothetical protein
MIAALVVLAVGFGVPVWAADTFTSSSTAGSTAFGFAPSPANLATFTHRNSSTAPGGLGIQTIGGVQYTYADDLAATCAGSAALGYTCATVGPTAYVPRAGNDGGGNASLPGAYTSSPNRTVSVTPDWACGTIVGTQNNPITTGGCDDDGASNLVDLVLGNEATADGFNTAPAGPLVTTPTGAVAGNQTNILASSTFVGNDADACGLLVACTTGTMIGNMTSVVNLNTMIGEDGMPSGSITFTRAPNASTACGANSGQGTLACFDTTLNHVLNQTISGLYTFAQTEATLAPMDSVASRHYNSTGGAIAGALFMPSVSILTNTSVTQAAMGGDASSTGGTDVLSWGTLWTNNGGHPGGGQFASPGLNVANWAGNVNTISGTVPPLPAGTPAVAGSPGTVGAANNPLDANGFR